MVETKDKHGLQRSRCHPNLEDPQDVAVGQSEAIRQLARLLRAGDGDQEPGDANVDPEDLQDADDDVFDAADQEPGGATKCAYCCTGFVSGEQHQMIDGQLYHSDLCAKFAKLIAIGAE